ncbi:S-protein homolog 2-like [Punica granatum]|uniref:S-protein homolog n=2 Tax=Punica granatum TaxID=22663 RepID=A0A218X5A3_PUNGR|nr:S-protein homolog 2-like [Punica granatum]OWM80114.1 hypothetical protein CDL15_Pgr010092 [Punica granatum]PKI40191.1 hypothetical protein CRG98_039443 [Punica granatum]
MNRSTFFVVALIQLLSAAIISNAWSLPKTRVRIYNKLPGNAELTIHCKSGDEDLGSHVIGANSYYEFGFIDTFSNKLYFCGLHWRGGSMVNDFYRSDRDSNRCHKECKWGATERGVLGINDFEISEPPIIDVVYHWGKPKRL